MHSHPPAPQAESEAARIRAAAELEAALAARDRVTAEQLAARDRAIAEQKVEITRLKAIAEPTKARFKKGNHFNAETDLAVIQVLALGLARRKVPKLFGIFARLFGIKLPGRMIEVPGPIVDGKRTKVMRFVFDTPHASHCKELAGVMYELNKLQVGQWLMEYMNSDESSCCWLADGAEAQQLERFGQLLARRIDGKLQTMALDCATLEGKTGEEAAGAFKASIEEVIKLLEEAGLADARSAELLRRFLPTCSMNDRASTARKAARIVLGLGEGEDDPTCAEHALVNVLEEGRKAMDAILRELMNFTDAQAEADAAKIKALRTCVGWFSSPVCALIYQVRVAPSRALTRLCAPATHASHARLLARVRAFAGEQVCRALLDEGLRHRAEAAGVVGGAARRRRGADERARRARGGRARDLRQPRLRLLPGRGADRAAADRVGALHAHLPG